MLAAFPEFCVLSQAHATLLGSPIGNSVEGIEDTIRAKPQALAVMGDRLCLLHAHDAFCLLRNTFTLPKMLYTLRTAPCFLSPLLQSFDDLQLADIANISLDANDPAWAQAVLPVWSGGLGVRNASQLAPSAILASAAGSSELTHRILPPGLQGAPYPSHEVALVLWSSGHEEPPPSAPASCLQRSWDSPRVTLAHRNLLETAPDAPTRACLRAARLATGPSCIIVLPARGQGGGPGGLGSPLRGQTVSSTCVPALPSTNGPLGPPWAKLPQEPGQTPPPCCYQ